MIKYPPIPIMPTLARPSKSVAALVTRLVVVNDFFTFSNKRSTPFSNVFISWSSALNPFITLIPLSDSVSRPVTSALISLLFLKMGRMMENAFSEIRPKTINGTITYNVIWGLILMRSIKATTEVSTPPNNCTSPVPTRLRTPSTSVMIRETSSPLLELSKNLIGS